MHVQTIDPHVVSDPAALQLGPVLPRHEIGTDRGAIKSYLEGVEALGLSHLLVYDHVLGASRDRKGGFDGHYDSEVAFHEPFTFLAFAAAVTNTIELATNVLILPQRQTALVPSKRRRYRTWGGRLRLAVGIGWNRIEYESLAVSFDRRGDRLDDQIKVMRQLWSADMVDVESDFHRIDRASILP